MFGVFLQVSAYIRLQEEVNKIEGSDEEAHRGMIVDIFQHEDKDRDGWVLNPAQGSNITHIHRVSTKTQRIQASLYIPV